MMFLGAFCNEDSAFTKIKEAYISDELVDYELYLIFSC